MDEQKTLGKPVVERQGVKKQGARRARKKTLALTKFDKALAGEVAAGLSDALLIQRKWRVDEKQFFNRVQQLEQAGLFTLENGRLAFSVKGFDKFFSVVRKASAAQADAVNGTAAEPEQNSIGEQAKQRQTEQGERQPVYPVHPAHPMPLFQPPSLQSPLPTVETVEKPVAAVEQPQPTAFVEEAAKPAPEAGGTKIGESDLATARLDLNELFEKGRGRPRQPKTLGRHALSLPMVPSLGVAGEKPPSSSAELKAVLEEVKPGEACELCKARFKVGGRNAAPKFGHCFCGAAYHKDCYETVSDDGGACLRCGRKLVLRFDKNAQEAFKEIKDAFE